MHQSDFEGFQATLKKLSEVFSKKITDETVQAYWRALKDQTLPTIQRLADSHTRYSKFFPKPFELRPKEDRSHSDPKADTGFQQALERNRQHWEEELRLYPAAARWRLLDATAARIAATHPAGSPLYAERASWLAERQRNLVEDYGPRP